MESVITKQRRKRSKSKPLSHIAAVKSAMAKALKNEWFFNRVVVKEPESKRDVRGSLLLRAMETVQAWDAVLAAATAAKARAGKVVDGIRGELSGGSDAAE